MEKVMGKYCLIIALIFLTPALNGCQTQQAADLTTPDDCQEYSKWGECLARPGWPDPPEEIIILAMPAGHPMEEPPVPFSHLVHSEAGCEQCHDVRRGRLVERMNFART